MEHRPDLFGAAPPAAGADGAAAPDRVDLARALTSAASAGETSAAETLLGDIVARFPQASVASAVEALGAAAEHRRWATVAYLADYLADTARPAGGGGPPPAAPEAPGGGRGGGHAILEAVVPRGGRTGTGAPRRAGAEGRPRVGKAVRFTHVDPEVPEGSFGSGSDPSPYFNLHAPASSLRVLQGADEPVLPGPAVRVVFDFPPEPLGQAPRTLTLRAPDGRSSFTRGDLGRAVAEAYRGLATSATPAAPWSHDLAELDLVEVAPLPPPRGGEGEAALYGLKVVA